LASPKSVIIVENIPALKKLQKASIPMLANRIKALIEFKKNEHTGISKRAVADAIGVNHNSVQTWRRLYEQGGIKAILNYPKSCLRGDVELIDWIEKTFKYNAVLKYSYRHFQSKIKVARISHVKKTKKQSPLLKKTLVKPVNK
jgi:transposase